MRLYFTIQNIIFVKVEQHTFSRLCILTTIMKQLTLNIADNKFQAFLEFIKTLDYVKVEEEGDSKEAIIANLKEGFKEMKLYKEGKISGTPLKDFLNEV